MWFNNIFRVSKANKITVFYKYFMYCTFNVKKINIQKICAQHFKKFIVFLLLLAYLADQTVKNKTATKSLLGFIMRGRIMAKEYISIKDRIQDKLLI